MSACQTPQHAPRAIDQGTTVHFTTCSTCHPSTEWTGVMVFNNGVAAPKTVAMTAQSSPSTGFDVNLSAAFTTALPTGVTTCIPIFTKISDGSVEYGHAQTTVVLVPITATAVPSNAQNMVTLLEGALAKLATSQNQSVSFNGQSFSKANIATYREQLTYWKAIVIQEQQALTRLRGGVTNDGRVITVFQNPNGCGPYPNSFPFGPYPLGNCCQ